MSDFVDQRTTDEPAGVGSEYLIHVPGPWDAPVRVIEWTPTSIRQLHMWVDFCRSACRLAEGELAGKIHAHTVEHR